MVRAMLRAAANAEGPANAEGRELDVRPFRIVSHLAEDGRVFNASFFDDEAKMRAFLSWYAENALAPGSLYHHCLTKAAAEDDVLPTGDTLLFGKGVRVLADQVLEDALFEQGEID